MRTGPYKLLRDFAQRHPNTRSALEQRSPASALEVLIQVVDTYWDNITALTEDDYDHLVVVLGELTDIVRDDESHIFAPLMEFALLLIERYDHAQMPELAERIENCRAQQVPNGKKEFAAG